MNHHNIYNQQTHPSDVSPEQTVDGGGAAVNASQHITGFAAQMPA